MEITDLVREDIKNMSAFSTIRNEGYDIQSMLDANESPFAADYNRYPDPYQNKLRHVLAQLKHVDAKQIIFGNGSDELIDIIIRTFCRSGIDKVRYLNPTFGMYAVSTQIHGALIDPVSLDDKFDIDIQATLAGQDENNKLLILCSPNNPTANVMSYDRMEEVIKGWKGIVVMDEAYIQFVEQPSFIKRLEEFPNLIVLQTFSKAYGAAGLRVGVGYASREVISFLSIVKPPYNLNDASASGALSVLETLDEVEDRISQLKQERDEVVSALQQIEGLEKVYPSDANFLLMKCRDHQALYMNLLAKSKILVRNIGHSAGCEGCLRISIGLPTENKQLIEAIKEYYKHIS